MTATVLILRAVIGTAVLTYFAACLALYFAQERLLFPGAFVPLPAAVGGHAVAAGVTTALIPTCDGESLFALVHPPIGQAPLVLLFHGNASYPEDYAFLFNGWIGAGYGFVAPAARGYPRSTGKADGEKMLADALDIHDWATRTYGARNILLVGHSLGTAVAIHLAARRPVSSVVLLSPFESMPSLVKGRLPYFPVGWLLR